MAFDNSPETEALREKARAMGLKFHPATGAKKLTKMMANYAEATLGSGPESKPENKTEDAPMSDTHVADPVDTSEELEEILNWDPNKRHPRESKSDFIKRIKLEQLKLMRVIVHCNNDDKKEMQGEIFTVANEFVGPVKRFVPFDNEEGWHIEKILYDMLKMKRCQKWRNIKLPNGMTEKQSFMVPEFTIEVLPPLTEEQLKKLADRQKATASIDT